MGAGNGSSTASLGVPARGRGTRRANEHAPATPLATAPPGDARGGRSVGSTVRSASATRAFHGTDAPGAGRRRATAPLAFGSSVWYPDRVEAPPPSEAAPWLVYVLASRTLAATYVGITRDLGRRLRQHNGELPGGARATRRGRPWRTRRVYGPFAERGEAQRVEHAVKRLRGSARLRWEPEPEDVR